MSNTDVSQFDQVTLIKKANVYHDGKVTSRTVIFADGSKKTLGIMLPGDYSFGTAERELMEIMAGRMDIKLPGEDWQSISAGMHFEVPANSRFELKVYELSDYCCSYFND